MLASRYATLCAVLCGICNLLLWCGFEASVFISEAILNSVHRREPGRIGAHDGYYGMAVTNVVFMVCNLAAPTLNNYFRGKWIMTATAVLFLLYFLSFLLINRWVFFVASAVLGVAFATFCTGYTGYLTEFSTRATLERHTALSWGVSSLAYMVGAIVNIIVTTINLNESNGTVSKYREYSDIEIRYFFAAFALVCCAAVALYFSLPNKGVKDNIAASNLRTTSAIEQFKAMQSVLVHPRVLLLAPFYFYCGLFFVFFSSIIPTTFQFTKAISLNVYIPAYYGFAFTAGSVLMSLITMKLSTVIKDYSLKPLMIVAGLLHLTIYIIMVCVIPEWSTVRPNDEPSLLIQPRVDFVLLLAFLFGLADVANNSSRIYISSLLLPATKQQTFGASKFYHALAACLLLFVSPLLSIYAYAAVLTAFLVASTLVFFLTCNFIRARENEEQTGKDLPRSEFNGTEKPAVSISTISNGI